MTSSPSSGRKALLIVGGVLAFVVLAALSFLYFRKDDTGSTSSTASATYPTTLSGVVVTAGNSAPTTVDVYEDFLCPICGRFESKFGPEMSQAVADGKIQLRYHPVAILDRATTPTGYATRAANAAICAASAGKFPAYHDKLFADQPAEGSAGLTDQELIAKGAEVGLTGAFGECVTSGKYSKAIGAATSAAAKDPAVRGVKGFGTPSVLVNGKRVEDWTNGDWLEAIAQ